MYRATYSADRALRAALNEGETDRIICEHFGISTDSLINREGTLDDYRGIDLVLPNRETIQKKNCECYSVNPRFSETVTIPCKNYHEYVGSDNIDWIFHSYYDRGREGQVRQWVLIRFSELVNHFDERRKRKNGKTNTWFYYWPYKKGYIGNRGTEISILDFAENYSIP